MLKEEAVPGAQVMIFRKRIGRYNPYFPDKFYEIEKVMREKGRTIVIVNGGTFLLTDLRLVQPNQGLS